MTVYPLTIQLGPLNITGYGIMVMVGFLIAGWATQLMLKERQLNPEYAADAVVASVIGGIVGAKLWYVAISGEWAALLSRAGLVWYGGFVGAALAVIALSYWKKVSIPFTADLTAPGLAIGYALGRVGCFLVNDDYGVPTNLPWGVKFPQGVPPSTVGVMQREFGITPPPESLPTDVLAVHPTQLYEVATMFVVFVILWRLRNHLHGTGWLFGLYLVLGGLERFLVEFLRAKDDRLLGPLTVAQAMSLALVIGGTYVVMTRWKANTVSPDLAALASPAPTPAKSG